MGVPESVFSLGPWDESGNPFTMSPFLRVTRVHSGARPPNAPTELSHFTGDAATHRRDTPEHVATSCGSSCALDACAAAGRAHGGPTGGHAPRRARPDLIAAYGSPFAADPRRSVRLRMYFKVHPRRWMAARSTGRSTGLREQPAVGERAWGTGHSHCESSDETRGTTRAKGPDLEPFWVLLQPPTEITD